MFFPLSAGRLAPVYSASLLLGVLFIITIFFIFCFKEQSGIQGKALPTAVTQACLAVWNWKMHFPRVTFRLKFKLLEFQEGVGAWVGYTSMYKHKHCQSQTVSIFLHSSHSHLSAPVSARFFFYFLMFHFPLHPSPIYWFLSCKCSLLPFHSSHFLLKNIFSFHIFTSPELLISFFSLERILASSISYNWCAFMPKKFWMKCC